MKRTPLLSMTPIERPPILVFHSLRQTTSEPLLRSSSVLVLQSSRAPIDRLNAGDHSSPQTTATEAHKGVSDFIATIKVNIGFSSAPGSRYTNVSGKINFGDVPAKFDPGTIFTRGSRF